MFLVSFLVVQCVVLKFCICSWGDRSYEFRSCVSDCDAVNCTGSGVEERLPWVLRLLRWSCGEECQYQCMWQVTSEDVRLNRPVKQFFGKWPFVRVFGVQEPASAIFSAFNGISVAIGFRKFRQQVPKVYPYHYVLLFQFLVNVHAWIWSTIFHSRDLYWTERLDYFSAASLIVTGIVVQFVRISGPTALKWHLVYALVWTGLFCCHVAYLSLFRFDYGYNIAASVLCGVMYSIVWVIWCIKNRRERPYVWKCIVTVVATSCFVLLEVLDFAPLWWTFDAHSLWHLSTIPLPLIWYSFLIDDANYEVKDMKRKQV